MTFVLALKYLYVPVFFFFLLLMSVFLILVHSHHVPVTSTGVNSSTARVYSTDSMNTTPTAKHQTAISGNKTITPAESGRNTEAHTPR